MGELNERDLERVGGGLTEQEQEYAAEMFYQQIVEKDCGGCRREDKSNCHAMLKAWCRGTVNGGGPRNWSCPMKQ